MKDSEINYKVNRLYSNHGSQPSMFRFVMLKFLKQLQQSWFDEVRALAEEIKANPRSFTSDEVLSLLRVIAKHENYPDQTESSDLPPDKEEEDPELRTSEATGVDND